MNGFKAYRYHLALKLHFTKDKFNVFENRGNIRVSLDAFRSRNDAYLFDRLAKKLGTDREFIQYVVANYAYGNTNYLYDEALAQNNYTQWIKVKESITKVFGDDVSTIFYEATKQNVGPDHIINCTNNDLPFIIKLYLGKMIQPQTITILNDITGMIDMWQNNPSLNIFFEDEMLRLKKLKGFFTYDKEKLQKIYDSYRGEL